ncbi:onanonoxo-7-onima-8-eninoihtemlysoneda [Lactifluus volemus]|nr:onanonoxo-7-onima-8-eninoihtemlysoneda [Lactifluus volemus]
MSLLFKNLRVHQVFGANTDVGKTILTSGLVRASSAKENKVFYLKPVSTGPMQDADDEHVKRHAGPRKDLVEAQCLYRFDEPVSPHLAASMAAEKKGVQSVVLPADDGFVAFIASYIRKCASGLTERSHMYIETAGGVHSPTLSGTTQLQTYRPLFLPTILVGDSRLGGISSTISAYESLLLRGYIVDTVLLFKDEYYRNWEYLEPYFAEYGVKVSAVEHPPPREADPGRNLVITEEYYRQLSSESNTGLRSVVEHLDERHEERLRELHGMARRTLDTVWWPFVQHGLIKDERDVNVIDSAWGDHFTVFTGHKSPPASAAMQGSLLEPQFDGSASWWTQALGHAHPSLTLAAARAAGRYGHVMYPQATQKPALRLADRLVHDGPGKGWASRAFISDNGSTGMEIALKMALRVATKRFGILPQERKRIGVLGLRGSYHGDTIGSMDACEEGVYTCEWHEAKGYWFEPPSVGIKNGRAKINIPSAFMHENVEGEPLSWIYNVHARLNTPLAAAYRTHINATLKKLTDGGAPPFGALVLEPLVLGAGGMIFVDPLFQRILIDAARARGLPVVFDEVFAGLWRLGVPSAASLLGAFPDVSVHAKILTGGLVPLAVTLASDDVFRAFEGTTKAEALLHGHSYTAYAIGCEVANETLDQIERLARGGGQERHDVDEDRAVWSMWSPLFVDALSKRGIIDQAMTLGTVLAFKVRSGDTGYQSHSAQALLAALGDATGEAGRDVTSAPGGAHFSIHFRTLGDVAYLMTSLNTPRATISAIENRVLALLSR